MPSRFLSFSFKTVNTSPKSRLHVKPLPGWLKRVPKSGIREIFDLTQGAKDVINLSIGEPDFDTPEHIKEAAKTALDEGFTKYTPNAGIIELREAISRKLKRENKIDTDPETQIIVTVGATQAVLLSLLVLLRRDEEVLIPTPGFMTFVSLVRIAGGIPKEVRVKEEDDFKVDPYDLRRKVTKKTKAIILNSPCNPTGVVLERKNLEQIAQVALDNDLFVISDEIYEKFVYDGKHFSIASLDGMQERVVTVNGFSKTYCMTGWRLGYAASKWGVISEMTKLQMYNSTCPVSFVQKAAIAALDGPHDFLPKMNHEFNERRKLISRRLAEIDGISFIEPRGTFYIFPNVKKFKMNSREFVRGLLSKKRVATVPGTAFGKYGEGYIRLSYAAPRNKIQVALERLEKFCGGILKR